MSLYICMHPSSPRTLSFFPPIHQQLERLWPLLIRKAQEVEDTLSGKVVASFFHAIRVLLVLVMPSYVCALVECDCWTLLLWCSNSYNAT